MQEEIKGPERSATATLSISDQTGAQQESVGLETRAAALWFLLITNPKFVNEVIHVVVQFKKAVNYKDVFAVNVS